MATHSSTLAWKNPMNRGAWWAAVHGIATSRTWLSNFTFTFHLHALEKEMPTHSSILVWRIPGTGEPGGLPSMGMHRVGRDWSDLGAACTDVSWTIKKAEPRRIDASELWCWRRLLRVPWTTRRSNQSILKEISPQCSLEGLMLKLKLQCFDHLMQSADSLEKILMLGKTEGRRRRGWQS